MEPNAPCALLYFTVSNPRQVYSSRGKSSLPFKPVLHKRFFAGSDFSFVGINFATVSDADEGKVVSLRSRTLMTNHCESWHGGGTFLLISTE